MSKLSDLSNERLSEMFADLSREQGKALETEKTAKYKKLYKQLDAVDAELKARGNEACKVLIPLLTASAGDPPWSYPAAQVRFNAAVHLKAVVPDKARATLKALVSSGPRKYRGMAGMSLSFDDRGISKPT